MDLGKVWMEYCFEAIGRPPKPPALRPLTPWEVVERLFDFHPLFAPRHEEISATPYSTAFDDAADAALLTLARDDDLSSWEALSAGAWRVLMERLVYSEVVAIANVLAGTPVIARLPPGLTRQQEGRALLLQFLLGGGRSIDRKLLPTPAPGAAPAFPNLPLRRH